MILALLLAAAPAPSTAIDAERAFAADAQKIGQWTAFRKWSTADAKMFVPQPITAHDFLAGGRPFAKRIPLADFLRVGGERALGVDRGWRCGGEQEGEDHSCFS